MHIDIPETQTINARFVQDFVKYMVYSIHLFLRKFKSVFYSRFEITVSAVSAFSANSYS